MSYIDSFDHEYIGHLGYLPIYHPLEDIDGDFCANSSNILFGGGAGEHPVLIVGNMDSLVARFILSCYDSDWYETIPNIDSIMQLAGVLDYKLFEYVGWHLKNLKRFTQMVRLLEASFCKNSAYELPFAISVNEWISRFIGELVYYCLPEMVIDESLLNAKVLPSDRCNIAPLIGYPTKKYGRLTRGDIVRSGYTLADRRSEEAERVDS